MRLIEKGDFSLQEERGERLKKIQ